MIHSRIRILLMTLVVTIASFAAAASDGKPRLECNASTLKSQFDRLSKQDIKALGLEIQDCIASEDDAIFAHIATLDPKSADEYRYSIASILSDTAFELYQSRPNQRNAKWWQEYLDHVSPPYSSVRVNRAIRDLNSIARLYDFPDYWPVLRLAMEKIQTGAEADRVTEVLSSLYRCDNWEKEIKAQNSKAPCLASCSGYFREFLTATSWASPPRYKSDAAVNLDKSRTALEGRLSCSAAN